MDKVIAFDGYNLSVTGGVTMTLRTASSDDYQHVPLVYAIHEASGQDVTFLKDQAYSLVTGGQAGGKVTHVC